MKESLTLFLSYPSQVMRRYLARERFTRLVTIGLFVLTLGFVALVVFAMTSGGMRFINNNPELRDAFQIYLIQLFVLIITWLSIGNAILVSAASFGRKSHQWIMSSPGFSLMGIIQLFQMTLSSVWIFAGVIIPVLLAVAQFGSYPVIGFIGALSFMIFLVISASSIGVMAFVGAINLLRKLSKSVGQNMVQTSKALILLLGAGMVGVYFSWVIAVPTDFVAFFEGDTAVQIDTVTTRFQYLPTGPMATALYQSLLVEGQFLNIGITLIGYAFIAVITLGLAYVLLYKQYLVLWQLLQEGQFVADKNQKEKRKNQYTSMRFDTSSVIESIMSKELLLIWRDRKNLFWMTMISILWILQTLVIFRITSNVKTYDVGLASLPDFLYAVVFAVGMYFVSALILRFVFPTFSSERKVAWILGVAPISLWRMTISKVMVYAGIFGGLGSILLLTNYLLLELASAQILEFWLTFVVSVLLITLLATFLSIRYPNRYSDDPEILSTTLPGLTFTTVALLTSFVIAYTLYLALSAFWIWAVTLGILLVICGMLLILIYQATKEFEYVGEVVA